MSFMVIYYVNSIQYIKKVMALSMQNVKNRYILSVLFDFLVVILYNYYVKS